MSRSLALSLVAAALAACSPSPGPGPAPAPSPPRAPIVSPASHASAAAVQHDSLRAR